MLLPLKKLEYGPNEKFLTELGIGERAVLEYTITNQNKTKIQVISVIDDLLVRKEGEKRNIPLVGMLGLTSKGYEICTIKNKQDLIKLWEKWREKNFRIPEKDVLTKYAKTLVKDR